MKYILKPIFIFAWWIFVSAWILVGKLLTLIWDVFTNTLYFLWAFKIYHALTTFKHVYRIEWSDEKGSGIFDFEIKYKTWHQMYYPWQYNEN